MKIKLSEKNVNTLYVNPSIGQMTLIETSRAKTIPYLSYLLITILEAQIWICFILYLFTPGI